jgi:hypothetical protein
MDGTGFGWLTGFGFTGVLLLSSGSLIKVLVNSLYASQVFVINV